MSSSDSKSKLTLWVDRESIRFGKEWAKHHRESLSKVVSEYFARLKAAGDSTSITPIVQRLSGVLKGKNQGKSTYKKHLEKKYLGS